MAYLDTGEPATGRQRAIRMERKRSQQRRTAGSAALAVIAIAIGGLLFWLAYSAVGEPAVAAIIVLLMMLPVASLAAASSTSGQTRR